MVLLLSCQVAAQSAHSRWVGAAENRTRGTLGLNELVLEIRGERVNGTWTFLPDVVFTIEEGVVRDGVISWWHRNIEGPSFQVELHVSPDGDTALCYYWGRYPNPKDDTEGFITYQRMTAEGRY